MAMFSTKYPNNIRTVSGLNVPVFNTDVVLAVNTTPGACSINLEQIPDNYWNTTWVLYVYDATNNATTNNITINAGSGQTVNNSSTFTIALNNGGVAIRILSNNQFIASSTAPFILTTTGSSGPATLVGQTLNIPQYVGGGGTASLEVQNQSTTLTTAATLLNFAGPGVSSTNVGGAVTVNIAGGSTSSLEVQNQSTTLTTAATLLNFTGAGVSSTNVGGAVTISIPGAAGVSVVPITNAAMLALINSNTVVPGQLYQITDAILNTGDLGVILTGTSTRSVSSNGTGLFFNADYQGAADYSAVVLPTYPNYSGLNKGIWYSSYAGTVAVGDVVIWNNSDWINTSGLWGGAPSSDPTNWQILPRSSTTGYILEADFVSYNILGNEIAFRLDKRGNQVTNSSKVGLFNTILDFQWGRNKNTQNIVCGLSNVKGMINSGATFKYNFFESVEIVDLTPDTVLAGNYYSNHLTSSQINITSNRGNVEGNTMNNGAITVSSFMDSGSVISKNTINSSANIIVTSLEGTITSNTVINGSGINVAICTGTIEDCYLKNGGTLTITTLSAATNVFKCEVSDNNTVTLTTVSTSLSNYAIRRGYSNWAISLSAIDVLTSTTINLISTYSYVGVFTITNITGSTISSITNLPTNHPCIFKPNDGASFRIVPIVIGSAVADNIVETSSTNVGGTTYTGRLNGCDEAVLGKYGTLVGLTIKNIWI